MQTKPTWIWKEIIHPCCFNDFLFLRSRSLHLLWFAYDVWIYEIMVSFYLVLWSKVTLDTFYLWYISNYRNKLCFGMLHFYCYIENNRNIVQNAFWQIDAKNPLSDKNRSTNLIVIKFRSIFEWCNLIQIKNDGLVFRYK